MSIGVVIEADHCHPTPSVPSRQFNHFSLSHQAGELRFGFGAEVTCAPCEDSIEYALPRNPTGDAKKDF